MRCTPSIMHQRSGLVFPAPAAYLPNRRVLFLASDGNIPVALSKSEGAGSVVALASLPGAHLNIRSSGMRLPDGCYGPATLLPCAIAIVLHSVKVHIENAACDLKRFGLCLAGHVVQNRIAKLGFFPIRIKGSRQINIFDDHYLGRRV